MPISEASARDMGKIGIRRDQIDVNHMGVELEAFEPGERASVPTLLYLGRLKRYKRIEYVLDALEAVPEAVLDLAGEGDHRGGLERGIEERGLTDRGRMHGDGGGETKPRLLQSAGADLTAPAAEGWGPAGMAA